MKIHFGYILAFAALLISGCAAFISVYGISQLFIGASKVVMIMGGALELGKLIIASYLQREGKKMNMFKSGYMGTMLIVLMLITSGGIYGFLSSAYQETNQKFKVNQNEISFLQQKEKFYGDDVARYDVEMLRISENIAGLSGTKANSIQVKDTTSSTGVRNTISTAGLRLASERIKIEEENRAGVMAKRSVASDSLQKYQLAILDKQNNASVSSELGPLIYISKLTGVEMDKVVNWFILLLIFVFDPLAIMLVVAATKEFQKVAEERKEETINIQPLKQEDVDKAFKKAQDTAQDTTQDTELDTELDVEEENDTEDDEIPEDTNTYEEPAIIIDEEINATVSATVSATTSATVNDEIIKKENIADLYAGAASHKLNEEVVNDVLTFTGDTLKFTGNGVNVDPTPATPTPKVVPVIIKSPETKEGGIKREEIKEIRENQKKKNRNFSRSIPAKRGYGHK
jgi:hypothetical protein